MLFSFQITHRCGNDIVIIFGIRLQYYTFPALFPEFNEDILAAGRDLGDTLLFRQYLHDHHIDELSRDGIGFSEPIGDLRFDLVDLACRFAERKPSVKFESQSVLFDELFIQIGVDGEFHIDIVRHLFVLSDGIFKHTKVERIPDLLDMPALRFPDDVPAPAYLKVMEGQGRTGAEIGVRFERDEPLFGIVSQPLLVGYHEVAVPFPASAPDTPPELMQVGDTEVVRTIHDHRIGMGHMNARLDNGGGEQYIILPVLELQHLIFRLFGGDLGVQYRHAELRQYLQQLLFLLFYARNGVEHIEDLSVAPHFA